MVYEQTNIINNMHDISAPGGREASSSSIMGNCAATSKASILQKGGYAHGLKTTGICQKLRKHFVWL